MSKAWTTPADLRARVRKRWDRGELLAPLAQPDPVDPADQAAMSAARTSPAEPDDQPSDHPYLDPQQRSVRFPWRLPLRGPSSSELSDRFEEVRAWIAALHAMPHLRVEVRELRHRVLGSNRIPVAAWIDSLEDALALIGTGAQARRFRALVAEIRPRQPGLLPWLARRPLRALELESEIPALLAILEWMQAHPRPGLYPRQVDLPGVHTKFIEGHRQVLSEWLDLTLPAAAIDTSARGAAGFARRYGLREKPPRIRLRLLDPSQALLPALEQADLTLDATSLARLAPAASRVFITENEINFLAFPPLADALVIFGSGYGFEQLHALDWLHQRQLWYWGDIDTHGFAILDQVRAHFPRTRSLLMDSDTLFAFEPLWGTETDQCTRDLPRLTQAEATLYNALRDNRIRPGLRLEQERIGFGWVMERLRALDGTE
ncbi:hypothetical protein Thiowin_02890 [Thiorhodovibrio winogradskyi]|uniref:Wadjet protein JetD C-terminal domain-containing protein n=1 Tax=Thiorhodovibrio winogradskyi TaxID=77007 RepID=A0ABZ0SBZ4_9GAMM|nr:Wadjet anti-phage system protein JetD domain-containing protein [Thiorhodovibrio winogradskyi]